MCCWTGLWREGVLPARCVGRHEALCAPRAGPQPPHCSCRAKRMRRTGTGASTAGTSSEWARGGANDARRSRTAEELRLCVHGHRGRGAGSPRAGGRLDLAELVAGQTRRADSSARILATSSSRELQAGSRSEPSPACATASAAALRVRVYTCRESGELLQLECSLGHGACQGLQAPQRRAALQSEAQKATRGLLRGRRLDMRMPLPVASVAACVCFKFVPIAKLEMRLVSKMCEQRRTWYKRSQKRAKNWKGIAIQFCTRWLT